MEDFLAVHACARLVGTAETSRRTTSVSTPQKTGQRWVRHPLRTRRPSSLKELQHPAVVSTPALYPSCAQIHRKLIAVARPLRRPRKPRITDSSDGASTIDRAPPTISPSMLLPENTMDAFALATSSRFESAGWTHRRSIPRAPRETTKAAVASSSVGPLQKGEHILLSRSALRFCH